MVQHDTNGDSPRLLIIAAHPDDAEFHAGGLAAIYRYFGHEVKMISVTDGRAGHQTDFGPKLVERRRREAAAAAKVIGATSDVWDHPDGELEPTLDVRWQIVAEMRNFAPHLILTHRTADYHPDHRAVAHAVRDAAYLVTVPGVVPNVPALRTPPVIAYMVDRFTRPTPFQADIAIDVTAHLETIVSMLACHASQVFQWLPYNRGHVEKLPKDEDGRRAWLRTWVEDRLEETANLHRQALVTGYGETVGNQVRFAEVLEISQYAAPLDAVAREKLFAFLPAPTSQDR